MEEIKTKSFGGKKIIGAIIKIALVVIILYFVIGKLAENWDEVIRYDWRINFPILILSIIIHLVTFALLSGTWCIIIGAFGYKIGLKQAFKISYIADLGRYLPGRIWPVFGMAYLARQVGIREETAVASWGLAMIFSLPSAFMAGLICIIAEPAILNDQFSALLGTGMYVAAAMIFLLSLLMIIIPNKMLAIVNILLKLLKRPGIEFNISMKNALAIYFGYLFCWLCYGLAFWLFVVSIAPAGPPPLLPAMAAFIIAYQIGYLAFFTPGGIGVRELVLTSILTPHLGAIAAGVAIAARIWNLLVEIAAALIALSIKLPANENRNN